MPPADSEHRELWSEVNETKQSLAKHLGECSVRHAEIIRRQDDSIRDRHGMNLKLDDVRAKISAVETRMLLLVLAVSGSVIGLIVNVGVQLLVRK